MRSQLSYVGLNFWANGGLFRGSSPRPVPYGSLPMFSSGSFHVSGFKWWSLFCCGLMFVWGLDTSLISFFCVWTSRFLTAFVEDAAFFPMCLVPLCRVSDGWSYLSSIRWMKLWILMFGSSSDCRGFIYLQNWENKMKLTKTKWVHPLISTSIRYISLRIRFRKRTFQKKWYLHHLIQDNSFWSQQ